MWFTLRPSLRIEAVGEVVWTDSSKRSGGLRFTTLAESERVNLRQWLVENGANGQTAAVTSGSADEVDAEATGMMDTSRLAIDDDRIVEFPAESTLRETPKPATPSTGRFDEDTEADSPVSSTTPEATPPTVPQPPVEPIRIARPSIVSSSPKISPASPIRVDQSAYATRREPDVSSVAGTPPAPFVPKTNQPDEDFSRFRSEGTGAAAAPSTSGQSPYSKYETNSILNEVHAGAMHRLLGEAELEQHRSQSSEMPSADAAASSTATSARAHDYAAPWRADVKPPQENVSKLAGALEKAGVPRTMIREFEIMVVGLLIFTAIGLSLLVFRQNVGEGVRWVGQQIASLNPSSNSRSHTPPVSPVDTNISPLLQPPPETHGKTRKAGESGGVAVGPKAAVALAGAESAVIQSQEDSGEAELANGLQYLRDAENASETNSAVKWLWASVEKGNTKAALVLADLYTWGRGVPQNCDQARVLLMSAERRGSTEAVQRLQDMDADGGCPATTKPASAR